MDDKGLALSEPLRTEVIEAAINILSQRPEVEEAFSLRELLKHKITRSAVSDYSMRDRYSQSVMAGRSGDIIVALKPGVSTATVDVTRVVIGHSGPYRYDTAVPIIFWWPGSRAQTRIMPTDTTVIAPTLANIMGVRTPDDLDGTCIDLGFAGAPKCRR